jgi:N-acetylmuramoyl-L-alanine amidase
MKKTLFYRLTWLGRFLMKQWYRFCALILFLQVIGSVAFFTKNKSGAEHSAKKKVTIMFHPTGSNTQPGRLIGDFFERGLTLQFIQLLKEKMLATPTTYELIILSSNSAGQTPSVHDHAVWANQQEVDLFVAFSMYASQEQTAQLSLFTYQNSLFVHTRPPELGFIPFKDAALYSTQQSAAMSQSILKNLVQNSSWLTVTQCAAPLVSLAGITRPACAIELGINQTTTIDSYVEPIASALIATVEAIVGR